MNLLFTFVLVGLGAALVVAVVIATRKRHRKALVVCPPAGMPAEVTADSKLRIVSCSRLPEGHTCDRHCLPQLGFTARDLGEFLKSHGGQTCVSCGASIGADDWYKSRLQHHESERRPQDVSGEVETHSPLCWDCFAGAEK